MTRYIMLGLLSLAVAGAVGCGGGSSAPNDLDKGKINAALTRIDEYCASSSASGAANNQIHLDVSTLIQQYDDSTGDEFQLTDGAEPTTMKKVLRHARTALGPQPSITGSPTACSQEEADRIAQALK